MEKYIENINRYSDNISIMEVCGTHTMKIGEMGIRKILRDNIKLVSGPGCPICVTPSKYIDYIYEMSLKENVIIATYGDMIRIPGSNPNINLQNAKSKGAKIKIILSPLQVIQIAKENRDNIVIFVSIGFETTTPATSILIQESEKTTLDNIKILVLNKKIKPAMETILEGNKAKINGFLCPGNLAVITGSKEFEFIGEYNASGVITGFSTYEILSAIDKLIQLHKENNYSIQNDYNYMVSHHGNAKAQFLISKYFKSFDDEWRGLGVIRNGSLRLKDEYLKYDILSNYPIKEILKNKKLKTLTCRCGEILTGEINPAECENFGKVCTPEFPIGPCMVSSEGTCASFIKEMKVYGK